MIPSSALIDSPAQCPACGQPVNAGVLPIAGPMPCCKRTLGGGQIAALLRDLGVLEQMVDSERKREGS